MKKWLAVLIIVGLVFGPISAIAKSGKGKGANPSDKAYEKANEKAKFLRSEDDAMGKGKHKGKNKDAAIDDGKKMKEKKARHGKASKDEAKKAKERIEKEYKSKGVDADKARKGAKKMKSKAKSKTRGE